MKSNQNVNTVTALAEMGWIVTRIGISGVVTIAAMGTWLALKPFNRQKIALKTWEKANQLIWYDMKDE